MKNNWFTTFLVVFYLRCFAQSEHEQCIQSDPAIHPRSKNAVNVLNGFTIPYVITVGETFKIAIKVLETNINQIELTNFANNSHANWRYKGLAFSSLILKDNGSQGDEKANDQVFTIDQITILNMNMSFPDHKFFRNADILITKTNGSTETMTTDLAFGIRTIPVTSELSIIKRINDTIQHTAYVFNIVSKVNPISNEVGKTYFKYMPDDRDFLMRATTYATPGTSPAADFAGVKNNITGYTTKTSPAFDRSALYGSNGKLMGFGNYYYTYGMLPSLSVHEILHYWCAFVDKSLKLDDGAGHWSTVEWPSSGFGSTAWTTKIQKVTDSTFKIGSGNKPTYYNNMELYLMGLLPFDSVPFPIRYLKNQGVILSFNLDNTVTVKGDGIDSVTKEQYLKVMDIRSPGVNASQKIFKTAFVVISDRLLSAKEMTYYDFLVKESESKNQSLASQSFLGLNFFSAARGKASLDARIANVSTSLKHENHKNMTTIFPNPATSHLFIASGIKFDRYSIFTSNGTPVQTGKLNTTKIILNNEYAEGMYFIHLQNREGTTEVVKTMIKNRFR